MSAPPPPGPPPDECSIKVTCRVRPLNAQEEKAGSKFILKFPTDDSININVSLANHDVKLYIL
jgi:hypothetical protein